MAPPPPPPPPAPPSPASRAAAGPIQLVFGREAGCDVVLDHPTVSTRHARLVWAQEGLLLEDLGSTNGTWFRGERVQRAIVTRGDDVQLGAVLLPWGEPRVHAFLRRGVVGGTVQMSAPPPLKKKAARARASRTSRVVSAVSGVLLLGALAAAATVGWSALEARLHAGEMPAAPRPAAAATPAGPPAASGPEEAIRTTRSAAIVAAIDTTEPVTRNTAVKLAAENAGPFHVEQVARIWTHVRGRWQYVNDPRGAEYFAKASETIANQYAGDCDDFSILLTAMITAIGGEARIVLMNGPEGGHAYAEACIRMPADEVAARLSRYYRNKWDPYLGRQRLTQIHFRSDETCPVWLNLDWNAGVPGGAYVPETWAVAVSSDGHTHTLAPAGAATASGPAATSEIRAASLPPAR